VLKLKKK